MKVDQIIDRIISGIHPDWDKFHIIRYVYIELGKLLSKDTDFFFSMDRKLGENNLSFDELKSIYDSEIGKNNYIICKSAASLLKLIYDKLGISSRLVKSLNNVSRIYDKNRELEVNHWILAVSDDNHTYFLTLASDLPYIKMGMETKHFGDHISFTKKVGDSEIQVYEGPEIHETVVPRDYLKQVDIDIGYVHNMYSYNDEAKLVNDWSYQYDDVSLLMVRDAMRGNRLYYDLELFDTDFYRDLLQSGDSPLEERKFSDISEEEWDTFIRKVCSYVYDKICELVGYEIPVIPRVENQHWNYNSWLLSLCFQVQDYIYEYLDKNQNEDYKDVKIDLNHFQFTKWSRSVKKKFQYDKKMLDYYNILGILDKMNGLIGCVYDHGRRKDFRKMFHSLAFHFIPADRIFDNSIYEDGYVSNHYIAHKFKKVFSHVFGCNEERGEFNDMEYSEQVVIIKEMLSMLFPELNKGNCQALEGYNDLYSPVFNRIQIYPIKHKSSGEYHIIFNIVGNNEDGDYYYFYNPKNNQLSSVDILDIFENYTIISDRMKSRINMEDDYSFSK